MTNLITVLRLYLKYLSSDVTLSSLSKNLPYSPQNLSQRFRALELPIKRNMASSIYRVPARQSAILLTKLKQLRTEIDYVIKYLEK